MLVFADIFHDLRLVTQFRIVLQALDEFIMVNQNDSYEIMDIELNKLWLEFGHHELQSVWNIPVFLLVKLDQIYAAFYLSMDVVVIRRIQISPKDILLVEHQLEKLN